MRHAPAALAGLTAFSVMTGFALSASSAEFDAALGKTGYGRCHMDSCGFFIIDATVPLGTSRSGTLFAVSSRNWDAQYRQRGENDDHEYDRPPVSIGPKGSRVSLVFCSKSRPMLFDYDEGKWYATGLRPGDETAVFGATESGYTFYYATCHHFITRDPVSKSMALKLGYTFADHPSDKGIDQRTDLQPFDVLK